MEIQTVRLSQAMVPRRSFKIIGGQWANLLRAEAFGLSRSMKPRVQSLPAVLLKSHEAGLLSWCVGAVRLSGENRHIPLMTGPRQYRNYPALSEVLFANTENPPPCQSAAVGLAAGSPKGLGRPANKPLMQRLRGMAPLPDRLYCRRHFSSVKLSRHTQWAEWLTRWVSFVPLLLGIIGCKPCTEESLLPGSPKESHTPH